MIFEMTGRRRPRIHSKLAGCALAALAIAPPASAQTAGIFAKGPNAVVAKSVTLSSLTIPEGGTISAPDGKSVSLTVDGVDQPIRAGTYQGSVVLSVTDPIMVKYHDLPPANFRAALYVDDGRIVPEKSVLPAVVGGTSNDNGATGIAITSHADTLNGVLVTGNSKYVLDAPVIEMVGNGGNDFAGWGAAIMGTGNSDLTINNARIHTKGAVRTAIFVGGHSTVHVNNADIYTESGTLPPDYVETLKIGLMKEVPWQLSLSGNVRTTNLVDHGTVYYNSSHIRSSGWGVLSVDDAAVTRMFVKDSLIETINSGYGAYSIGDSIDTFDHTTMNVADYGLIIAGRGSGVFTNGSVVNSRRFGVMQFDRDGGGSLTVDKGTVFNTRLTTFLFKGRGGRLTIDNATMNPGNGIILHAMIEDNPRKVEQKLAAEKARAEAAAAAAAAPTTQPIIGERTVNPMGNNISPDVLATVHNTQLTGDFLNTRTTEGGLVLKLEHSSITGAISTGRQQAIDGKAPTKITYWQIGQVNTTIEPTADAAGVTLSIDRGSRWVVAKTSYITQLDIAPGGAVLAPDGHSLAMKIDGKVVPIRPGSYKGAITLELTANHRRR